MTIGIAGHTTKFVEVLILNSPFAEIILGNNIHFGGSEMSLKVICSIYLYLTTLRHYEELLKYLHTILSGFLTFQKNWIVDKF